MRRARGTVRRDKEHVKKLDERTPSGLNKEHTSRDVEQRVADAEEFLGHFNTTIGDVHVLSVILRQPSQSPYQCVVHCLN